MLELLLLANKRIGTFIQNRFLLFLQSIHLARSYRRNQNLLIPVTRIIISPPIITTVFHLVSLRIGQAGNNMVYILIYTGI